MTLLTRIGTAFFIGILYLGNVDNTNLDFVIKSKVKSISCTWSEILRPISRSVILLLNFPRKVIMEMNNKL